jgi:putative acetyltransferase
MALRDNKPAGHVLFTKAKIEGYQKSEHVALLAPLAILPEYQGEGIGGLLIKEGLRSLKEQGTEMVFVLGDPDYYRKYGFVPEAGSFGFDPPFPIPERYADAWMVQALTLQGLSKSVGKLIPANALNQQKYWTK